MEARTFWNKNELDLFLSEATDAEFRACFKGYLGTRGNFDYSKYAFGVLSKRLRLSEESGQVGCSTRQVRIAYKVALAEHHSREKEFLDRLPESETINLGRDKQVMDCLRCLLIQQGAITIPDFAICACTIEPPNLREIGEEALGIKWLSPANETDYLSTLTTSTVAGSLYSQIPIAEDVSLWSKVAARKIDTTYNLLSANPYHKCIQRVLLLSKPRTYKLNVFQYATKGAKVLSSKNTSQSVADVSHRQMLLYAPPGFGKTALQHRLLQDGVLIMDTDDVPCTNLTTLHTLLEKTVVVTNQLNLAKKYLGPKIFWNGRTWMDLKKRVKNTSLSDDDYHYWWQTIEACGKTATVCHIHGSYLTDWFILTNHTSGKAVIKSTMAGGDNGVDTSQLKGLSKYFNGQTHAGRANVAKLTYASIGLIILYNTLKPKKK